MKYRIYEKDGVYIVQVKKGRWKPIGEYVEGVFKTLYFSSQREATEAAKKVIAEEKKEWKLVEKGKL